MNSAEPNLTRRLGALVPLPRWRRPSVRRSGEITRAPERLKAAVRRLLVRAREGLDIPSRNEVVELADRLEAIDRKLAALEQQRVARASAGPKPKPAPAEKKPAAAGPRAARKKSDRSNGKSGDSAAPRSAAKKKSSRRKTTEKKTGAGTAASPRKSESDGKRMATTERKSRRRPRPRNAAPKKHA